MQAVNIDWPPRIDPVPQEGGDTATSGETTPAVAQPQPKDQQKQEQEQQEEQNSLETTAATEVSA